MEKRRSYTISMKLIFGGSGLVGSNFTDAVKLSSRDVNLLSYKWGSVNANTLDALGGEEFATENFNFILGQGVGLFNTSGGWSGNLNTLEEGKGYWINIANSNIDFKWGFDNCGDNISNFDSNAEFEKQLPEEFQFIQSTKQAFYLIKDLKVDGDQPNLNDIILAYNGDILVGSAFWAAEYTVLPVMGDDYSEYTRGFCKFGDDINIKLYRQNNGDIIDLVGDIRPWDDLLVTEVDLLKGQKFNELPVVFSMEKAYPNPFNPVTNFKITIPESGYTQIGIYDIGGKLVESILNENIDAGLYQLAWDADENPSGLYIIKAQFGKIVLSEKIILVK